jgi:dimethylglycine dehydrogenase
MLNYLFDRLMDVGRPLGLKPFGIRAMESMRLEKSYRLIPRELSIEYAALESGLDRFVRFDKGDFAGRDGLTGWSARGFANRLAMLEVHAVTDADARGSEPVWHGGELVGRTTSGGFGWRVRKSLAMAMVRPDLALTGTRLEITILGERREATVIPESPFDPENRRLRG